jgi:hypothetical protein
MAHYRLYFLDGFSKQIDHFREFEADGDLAAIAQAEEWRGIAPMELWSRHRKVRWWGGLMPAPRVRTLSHTLGAPRHAERHVWL